MSRGNGPCPRPSNLARRAHTLRLRAGVAWTSARRHPDRDAWVHGQVGGSPRRRRASTSRGDVSPHAGGNAPRHHAPHPGDEGAATSNRGARVVRGSPFHPLQAPGQSMDASLYFLGAVAEQGTKITASMDGARLAARVDVPVIDPMTLAEAMESLALEQAGCIARGGVGGPPGARRESPRLGRRRFDRSVAGNCRLDPLVLANAEVTARGVDVQSFSPAVGHSTLNLKGTASAKASNGMIDGDVRPRESRQPARRASPPPRQVTGRFTQASIVGSAKINEVGAPAEVAFDLHPSKGPGSDRDRRLRPSPKCTRSRARAPSGPSRQGSSASRRPRATSSSPSRAFLRRRPWKPSA